MSFNDQIHTTKTDDLEQAISDLAPKLLKTRVIIIVKKGKEKCEKMLLLKQGLMLFRNKTAREVFVNRLIFK